MKTEMTTRIDGATRLAIDHQTEGDWIVALTTSGDRRMYDLLAPTNDVESRAKLYAAALELLQAASDVLAAQLRDFPDAPLSNQYQMLAEAIARAEGRE